MNFKPLLRLAVGFLAGVILWFVGWLLYALLDLWALIKPAEFQNILVIGLGLTTLIGAVLAHRALRTVTIESEHNVKSPATPAQPELKELRENLDKLTTKVDDSHAFLPILKKRADEWEAQEKLLEARETELTEKEETMEQREKKMKVREDKMQKATKKMEAQTK